MKEHPFLILLGLLVISSVFFTCCTTQEFTINSSNPNLTQSPLRSDISVVTITESPLRPENIIKYNQTWLKRGSDYALAQNATAYLQIDNNTPYELSLGTVSIQPNKTRGTVPSYIAKINLTIKNSGTFPIQVTFATLDFSSDSGDGCHSPGEYTCGVFF